MVAISPHTTRATGTILTAVMYNGDHGNHIANAQALNAAKTEKSGIVVDGHLAVWDGTAGNLKDGGESLAPPFETGDFADDSVTNAKLADMAQGTIKGRAALAGTGNPQDLTGTQATAILDEFTSSAKGLVPASGGGTTTFLRADGTFASPGGMTTRTAQTTNSGTAFDFTSIPSTVNRITVMFNEVDLSGSDSFLIQLGDSGGFETTGYNSSSFNRAGQGESSAGFMIYRNDESSSPMSGMMIITKMTGNTWVSMHGMHEDENFVACAGGGSKTLSATLDRLRITRDGTDTFTAGQVTIMYE